MKRIKISMLAIMGCAMLAVVSCKKDNPTPAPQGAVPSLSALKDFYSGNRADAVQLFTIASGSNQTITGSKGTMITFNANSFETMSGAPVTGNVQVELIEIFNKKDMILMNVPTMGNTVLGTAPLISGGEFRIKVKQNGQELRLKAGMNYTVIAPAVNGFDPNMDIFYGEENSDTITWNQADSSAIWGQGNQYYALFDSLNWVNLDYFMNSGGPQTLVRTQLPSGFNNQNCSLFISVDGTNTIASVWNYENGMFTTAPSYTLPIGMNVHFVAIAMINDVPHAAIVAATIGSDHLQVISALTATTEAQLSADLADLP